jgi:cysteine-rich repeat protein
MKPAVCGNGTLESPEACDDGNTDWTTGEHCTAQCETVDCGDPNDSGTITTSDAQFALRASVGSSTCSPKVCDANANGSVTTSDAQLVLRKAVSQPVTLACPQ